MFQEFSFSFLGVQVQLAFLVVKTRLVAVREQVFDEKPLVDHHRVGC